MNSEGRLLTCGANLHGTTAGLGHGASDVVAVPTLVVGLAAVRMASVSAGAFHTLALSEEGTVYSFGYGGMGQLGHGNFEDQRTPRAIEALRGVRVGAVLTGISHSLMLGVDGLVYAFGASGNGRLGHDGWAVQRTPRAIEALRGVRAIAVSAGGGHSLVLGSGGEVYSFGVREDGQLGHGNTQSRHTPRIIEALKGVRVRAVPSTVWC